MIFLKKVYDKTGEDYWYFAQQYFLFSKSAQTRILLSN